MWLSFNYDSLIYFKRKGLKMEQFIQWLVSSFGNFIETITAETVDLIDMIINNVAQKGLIDYDINLVLFSDTPILITNGYDLITLFFSIFYSVIFVVIVYKIIKKVFVKITGWKRW